MKSKSRENKLRPILKDLDEKSSFQKYKAFLRAKIELAGINLVSIMTEVDRLDFIISDIRSIEEAEEVKSTISDLFADQISAKFNIFSKNPGMKTISKSIMVTIEPDYSNMRIA